MAQAKTKTDRRTKPELLAALAAEEARGSALRTRLADAEARAGTAERQLQDEKRTSERALQEEKRRSASLQEQVTATRNRNDVLEGQLEESRRAGKKVLKRVFKLVEER